jgi:hypothetical protein
MRKRNREYQPPTAKRLAQSATLRSVVRSVEETAALAGTSKPSSDAPIPDSAPERNVHRTLDSARTHDYKTADSLARQAAYRQQVDRVTNIRKSSKAQRSYVEVLLTKLKDHNSQVWTEANAWWQRMDSSSEPSPIPFALADKTIKRLLHYLNQPAVKPDKVTFQVDEKALKAHFDPYDDVPSGYYALPGSDMTLHFYRVSRWKGSNRIRLRQCLTPSGRTLARPLRRTLPS